MMFFLSAWGITPYGEHLRILNLLVTWNFWSPTRKKQRKGRSCDISSLFWGGKYSWLVTVSKLASLLRPKDEHKTWKLRCFFPLFVVWTHRDRKNSNLFSRFLNREGLTVERVSEIPEHAKTGWKSGMHKNRKKMALWLRSNETLMKLIKVRSMSKWKQRRHVLHATPNPDPRQSNGKGTKAEKLPEMQSIN